MSTLSFLRLYQVQITLAYQLFRIQLVLNDNSMLVIDELYKKDTLVTRKIDVKGILNS